MQKAILVDVDGTILVQAEDTYFLDRDFEVVPISSVCDLVMLLFNAGCRIIFLTAREEEARDLTLKHIEVCLPELDGDYELYMRPTGDKRSSGEFKLASYEEEISQLYDVVLYIDDLDENIEAFKAVGMLSLQC